MKIVLSIENDEEPKITLKKQSFKKMTEYGFFCKEDALKTAEKWIQYFLSVVLNNVDLIAIRRHESGKRDRSSKDEELNTYYRIDEIIKTNEMLVLKKIEKMELFILASNNISISPKEMLIHYKGRDNVKKDLYF